MAYFPLFARHTLSHASITMNRLHAARSADQRRIIEMEMWDQEFVDMEVERHFNFGKDNLGSFQFGLVQGQIDYRIEKIGEQERIEFSWEGKDETDDALGRGWAVRNKIILKVGFTFILVTILGLRLGDTDRDIITSGFIGAQKPCG